MMEPPAKRQKLSDDYTISKPTRTIDLASFQRPVYKKRSASRILLPRVPDVTVTAGVVEVAVNEGSSVTEIVAPTADATVTLGNLGTVTVPAVDPSSGAGDLSSGISSLVTDISNATAIITTDHTVTVTATSTFRVSYLNGTFVLPATTKTASHHSDSSSNDDFSSDSDSDSSTNYTFGQGISDTATDSAAAPTAAYQHPETSATITQSNNPATSSNESGHGGTDAILTPQQTQMVGGIVGGIAGIALVLIAILFLLRRYKLRLRLQERLQHDLASSPSAKDLGDAGLIGLAAPMSLTSRSSLFTPATSIASDKKKVRPESDMTVLTNSTSNTGVEFERGFQRVSGRKIPSVLTTGGDQFGGSYGAFEKEIGSPVSHVRSAGAVTRGHRHDLSESSFYPDHNNSSSTALNHSFSHSVPTSPQYPAIFTSPPQHPLRHNQAGTPTNYSHPYSNLNAQTPTSPPRAFSPNDFDLAFYRNITAPSAKPDGFAISRNSPARTPVIQSPSASTLRLPIHAPVSMDEDIPEMPLPSPNIGIGIALGHELALAKHRVPSPLNGRHHDNMNLNGAGRFKEDLKS